MLPRRLFQALSLAPLLLFTARGAAADGAQPVAYVSRPLTLPKLVLVPQLSVTLDQVSDGTISMLRLTTPKNLQVAGELAVRFGVLSDIEVGAVVAPVEVSPAVAYGDPSVYGTFRFIRSTVEMAATVGTTFITHPSQDPSLYLPVLGSKGGVLFAPGLLARIHGEDLVKVDVGGQVLFQLGDGARDIGLRVPIEVAFNLHEQVFLGARTGFGVVDFAAPQLQTSYLPLGAFVGYSVPADGGPVLDLQGSFTWPKLVTPGAASKLDYADYQVGFSVAVYLYLL